MPATLTATAIHAGYPGNEVLRGLDLRLMAGAEPLGLLGPSGAGKTTLIRVLTGQISPSMGQVRFNTHNVTRRRGAGAREFRAGVRVVSQDSLTVTDPKETVDSRLKEAFKVARRAGRTHSLGAEEALSSVGLPAEFLGRRAVSLSGGERQRLALASALATRPQILILDEPLTAVDPHARAGLARGLRRTIERLGIGALVASHDLELIGRLCPSVVFLADGRIVQRGALREVLADPQHPEVAELADYALLAAGR